MQIQYNAFQSADYDAVKEIIKQDTNVCEEFLWSLENEANTLITAKIEHEIVAIIQIKPETELSYLTVFVAPKCRRKGIGTACVDYAEKKQCENASEFLTSFHVDSTGSALFARKCGYGRSFSSAYMQRTGEKFSVVELSMHQYTDEDYLESHALCELAFHEMRVRVGDFPNSAVEQASDESRKAWSEDFMNRFVYKENNEIVGFGNIVGNEIDSVSVRVDMQGRGIGKKLAMYLCNEIYSRGYDAVVLWCVVGNYARGLYDNLGFHEKFIAEFATKNC